MKGIIAILLLVTGYLLPANTLFAQSRRAQKEDSILQAYFAKNDIHPTLVRAGLYMVIIDSGEGDTPIPGQGVTVYYTGRTLNGKVFDSNTDPAFDHLEPLNFVVGTGQVITGWDIGLQQLSMGAKAVLYIPSALAYGAAGSGREIPPNSILIFDVELIDII